MHASRRFFNDDEAIEHLRAVLELEPKHAKAQAEVTRLTALARDVSASSLLETPVKPVLRCALAACMHLPPHALQQRVSWPPLTRPMQLQP